MPGYLPDDWIEDVRSASDIVDVIGSYVPLKKSGGGFFGVCPFHSEKTASFHVEPERQIYHCFGCGVGGNVFSFIMAIEHLGFIEAAKLLAERANIPIPEATYNEKEYDKNKLERDRNYEANRETAYFYYNQLINDRNGKARQYVEKRGINKELVRKFGIGYAVDGWTHLKEYLMNKGYTDEELIKYGLLVKNNERSYDRFRNRLIIPIIDERNRVLGFGGRVLDDSLPKYINSSDSPIYQKKNSLFGINAIKKIRPLTNVIMVEGYMDVITLHQYGFQNTVASLGTSLTAEQAKIIRRYAKEIIIAYDGDQAGQKATLRGMEILDSVGCKVKVIQFPDGLDPDETLRKRGKVFFQQQLNEAVSLTEYKIKRIADVSDLTTMEGKTSFATQAIEVVSQVKNLLERDVYIQKIVEITGFEKALLYQQIQQTEVKIRKQKYKKTGFGNINHASTHVISTKINGNNINKAERDLLLLMTENEAVAKKACSELFQTDFSSTLMGEIFYIIFELLNQGKAVSLAVVLNEIRNQEKMKDVTNLFLEKVDILDVNQYAEDCIEEIKKRQLKEKIQRLKDELAELEKKELRTSSEYKERLNQVFLLSRELYSGK